MNVNLSNILLIWSPEILLNYCFGLLMWKGKDIFKEKINIVKLIIATIGTIVLINIIKQKIDSVIITTLINILVYMLFFKWLWKANYRCSCIISILIVYLIMISEIATMQFMNKIIQSIIENNKFFDNEIIWTIPTRLIQFITIITILKFNLTFKSSILINKPYDEFSKSERVTVNILIRHLIVSIILNSCYSEIFVRCIKNDISTKIFEMPLYIALLGSIYFLLSSLQLFYRTTLAEDLKLIFFRSSQSLFKLMLKSSDINQISEYQLQLDKYIHQRKGGDVNEEHV